MYPFIDTLDVLGMDFQGFLFVLGIMSWIHPPPLKTHLPQKYKNKYIFHIISISFGYYPNIYIFNIPASLHYPLSSVCLGVILNMFNTMYIVHHNCSYFPPPDSKCPVFNYCIVYNSGLQDV